MREMWWTKPSRTPSRVPSACNPHFPAFSCALDHAPVSIGWPVIAISSQLDSIDRTWLSRRPSFWSLVTLSCRRPFTSAASSAKSHRSCGRYSRRFRLLDASHILLSVRRGTSATSPGAGHRSRKPRQPPGCAGKGRGNKPEGRQHLRRKRPAHRAADTGCWCYHPPRHRSGVE